MSELKFKIVRMDSDETNMTMIFDLEVTDEYTLGQLERKYRHRLQFDGGQVFTLRNVTVPLKGAVEESPELWDKIKTDEELISKFVLARLKGEI
jgi:hypothetical protein